MRRLGVAAVSAALVGTIAAVMPAGIAHADVSGTRAAGPASPACCAAAGSTGCWRYTSIQDVTNGSARTAARGPGQQSLQLTPATHAGLANAAWYNTPINITGKAIEASFTAYLDSARERPVGSPRRPRVRPDRGRPPSESDVGNNQPAPVPFPADRLTPGTGVRRRRQRPRLQRLRRRRPRQRPDGRQEPRRRRSPLVRRRQRRRRPGVQRQPGRPAQGPGMAADPADPDRAGSARPHRPLVHGQPGRRGAADLRRHAANTRPVHMGVQLDPTGTADTWHAKVYVDGAEARHERAAAERRCTWASRPARASSRSATPSPT